MKPTIMILALIALAACTPTDTTSDPVPTDTGSTTELSGWMTMELTDVSTGETFTASQFEEPVLLETFAIWCPVCKSQQNRVKDLHEIVGDSVVSIGVNIDPAEDEQMVKDYIDEHGFDWRYAVAPAEFTQGLVDEFGLGVANAPSTPIILICNNEATLLRAGVKEVDELQAAVEGCA